MGKYILKVSLIIFGNLLAFGVFGIILGALFGNTKTFILGAVIVSIIPVSIFLYIEVQKTLQELQSISKQKNDTIIGSKKKT